MNWTKVSAVAEIVSSVAVLATLAYLAIQTQQVATQTQQNTDAIISNSRQQSLDAELQVIRMMMDHPVVNSTEELDRESSLIRGSFHHAVFRVREAQWLQYQDGQLDRATWEASKSTLLLRLRDDSMMETWKGIIAEPAGYNSEFLQEVNNALAE